MGFRPSGDQRLRLWTPGFSRSCSGCWWRTTNVGVSLWNKKETSGGRSCHSFGLGRSPFSNRRSRGLRCIPAERIAADSSSELLRSKIFLSVFRATRAGAGKSLPGGRNGVVEVSKTNPSEASSIDFFAGQSDVGAPPSVATAGGRHFWRDGGRTTLSLRRSILRFKFLSILRPCRNRAKVTFLMVNGAKRSARQSAPPAKVGGAFRPRESHVSHGQKPAKPKTGQRSRFSWCKVTFLME